MAIGKCENRANIVAPLHGTPPPPPRKNIFTKNMQNHLKIIHKIRLIKNKIQFVVKDAILTQHFQISFHMGFFQ